MAARYHDQQRPASRRQPLGPGDARANMHPQTHTTHTSSKAAPTTSISPGQVPHKKSTEINGSSGVRTSPVESTSHRRVSDIKRDSHRPSKRDSEISNASSTASGTRKRTIGQWQLGKTVGRGGCSTVRLVRHVVTGQVGAVKIISRKMAEQVRAQSLANLAAIPDPSLQDLVAAGKAMPPPPPGLMREIAIMKLLDHPNIVRLYDVWENHNELYLVMEYVQGGELFHYVEECRGLDEKETVYIFRQIVAALLYCHRLHIHHRDLKPENILLDRENAQVKLVDFGMAALQPEGKYLTTACGSPHYAAPEVIRSRPYDGAKADVWSCGVILYVMLTGTTPFNYDHERNLAVMYGAIARADYYMPPELSFHAKDLLKRIFCTQPDKRISMDEIWEHPLLHKYDKDFGYEGELARKDAWIGPTPTLDEWTVTREEDIDKDIIRNMRTLWHSVPQQVLVKKLLSREPNQEKYFYAALLKHREENLEDYTGSDGVSCSASDYQHNKASDAGEIPAVPATKQTSQSSYSIMNNEHLRSSSVAERPPSESSYDPYRPGRYPLQNKSTNYTRTVVHRRGQSGASAKGAALRVETLKKANKQATQARSISAQRQPPTAGGSHSRSVSRSSVSRISRQSLASSQWASSPPVAVPVRPNTSHKRNVSFQHVRRTSGASAVGQGVTVTVENYTPELQQKALETKQHAEDEQVLSSSPTARAAHDAHTRKARTPTATPRGRTRKPETPGHIIRSEVRKVSTELEKACEEAFFRSSYASSNQTSATEPHSPYDTPPSSVSAHQASAKTPETGRRPLPALPMPVDTPNTFLARTLEETRNKLAARVAMEGTTDAAKLQAVLADLERIMPAAFELEKRVTSAPEPKSAVDLDYLPVITEEPVPDTLRVGKGSTNGGWRSFTAPHPARDAVPKMPADTIRFVEPSPKSQNRPVGPRRPSAEDVREEIPRPKTADGSSHPSKHLQVPNPHEHLLRKKSADSAVGLKMSGGKDEDAVLPLPEPTLSKKKSSWFRRWKDAPQGSQPTPASGAETAPPHPGVPISFKELDDREAGKTKPNNLKRDKQAPQPLALDTQPQRPAFNTAVSYADSEFPFRRREENESKLSKWLGKLPGGKKDDFKAVEIKDPLPSPGLFSATPPSPVAPATPATPGEVTRSWFSRFLRIRPESRVLCFSVSRGRARSETYKLLRDWQRHGIADLCYLPQENCITARVDKNNALGIKPVAFRIELFVVLQSGRKAGLSLGRWTQVRGAASSFRRVVDVAEQSLAQRKILVEDEEQKRELEMILS